MANCPKCGSDDIQMRQEATVNWGRAAAGWALFGVVGGAVGAVTGEDRHSNFCLDCGTAWRAQDLYNILQQIKKHTGVDLKLARRDDRQFMDNFITDIGPFLEFVNEQEQHGAKLLQEAEEKSTESTRAGCMAGTMFAVAGCTAMAGSGWGVLLVLIIPPLVLSAIGAFVDNANQQKIKNHKKEIQRTVEIENKKAKKQLKEELMVFLRHYTIEDEY